MMVTPNRGAAEALQGLEVHALTDITGFGLLGHLVEMLTGSRAALPGSGQPISHSRGRSCRWRATACVRAELLQLGTV